MKNNWVLLGSSNNNKNETLERIVFIMRVVFKNIKKKEANNKEEKEKMRLKWERGTLNIGEGEKVVAKSGDIEIENVFMMIDTIESFLFCHLSPSKVFFTVYFSLCELDWINEWVLFLTWGERKYKNDHNKNLPFENFSFFLLIEIVQRASKNEGRFCIWWCHFQ